MWFPDVIGKIVVVAQPIDREVSVLPHQKAIRYSIPI